MVFQFGSQHGESRKKKTNKKEHDIKPKKKQQKRSEKIKRRVSGSKVSRKLISISQESFIRMNKADNTATHVLILSKTKY